MKIFNGVIVLMVVSVVAFMLSLAGSIAVFAATTPSLGVAGTYGVLSSTYTNTVPGTIITGDLGYTTPPAMMPTVNGTIHIADGSYNQAGTGQGTALANLNSQACTFTFAAGAIDLATDTTHGPIGVYTPGVYCTSGAASIGTAGITLSGSGTYIFRINGALTSVVNSSVTVMNGASTCDIFWTPIQATTLGANSTFRGTNIDASGITMGNNVTFIGRALAFGGTVTTDVDDNISVPVCTTPTPTPTPTPSATPTPTPTPSLTPTPTPSATPTPTPTPSATPTPTPTPSLTLTPTPSVTPTPTPTPSLTPTPSITPVPGLPNTGIGPDDVNNISWNTIIPIGLFIALFSFYLARKRQVI